MYIVTTMIDMYIVILIKYKHIIKQMYLFNLANKNIRKAKINIWFF